jgi:hypothetical protein
MTKVPYFINFKIRENLQNYVQFLKYSNIYFIFFLNVILIIIININFVALRLNLHIVTKSHVIGYCYINYNCSVKYVFTTMQ